MHKGYEYDSFFVYVKVSKEGNTYSFQDSLEFEECLAENYLPLKLLSDFIYYCTRNIPAQDGNCVRRGALDTIVGALPLD